MPLRCCCARRTTGPYPRSGRNKKTGSAEYIAIGKTDGGRTLVIPFDYDAGAVRPITAWKV